MISASNPQVMVSMDPAADVRQANQARMNQGFTLIELILTLLLISIAVLGVSYALGFGLRHQSDAIWQVKAVALADSYLEESLARRYDENTPVSGVPPCSPVTSACSAVFSDGETRPEFDDVDDYDGLNESPPRDVEGLVRSGYDGYRVQVAVRYLVASEVTSLGLDDASDAKIVTVSVSSPSGSAMNFSAVKGNF